MKTKLMFLVAVLGCATSGLAGVLFWTVNTGASTQDVNEGTPSTSVQSNYNDWNYASLVHYDSALSYPSGGNSTGTAVKLAAYNDSSAGSSTATKIYQTDLSKVSLLGSQIDQSTYSSGVFYIELYNSSGNVVGRSGEYIQYNAENGTFSTSNGATVDFVNSFADFTSSLHTWNGGSTYVAVPEPTSGVMLLLGAALLGLRRRRA